MILSIVSAVKDPIASVAVVFLVNDYVVCLRFLRLECAGCLAAAAAAGSQGSGLLVMAAIRIVIVGLCYQIPALFASLPSLCGRQGEHDSFRAAAGSQAEYSPVGSQSSKGLAHL